jgi:hypothetical protein
MERLPISAFLLLDRSDVMSASNDAGSTYWQAVTAALERFVELPYTKDARIALGYFPDLGSESGDGGVLSVDGGGMSTDGAAASACRESPLAVPFGRAGDNASAIRSALAAASPAGDRPMGPALQSALAATAASPDVGRRIVVVITAGEPNACEPRAEPGLSSLTSAYSPAVETALIGVGPNVSGFPALHVPFRPSLFVNRGDLSNGILTRLLEVLGFSPGCVFQIPAPPQGQEFDPRLVNLQIVPYGGQPESLFHVGTADGCATNAGEGWYYDNPVSPTEVRICSATCDRIPGSDVQILLGCRTRRP